MTNQEIFESYFYIENGLLNPRIQFLRDCFQDVLYLMEMARAQGAAEQLQANQAAIDLAVAKQREKDAKIADAAADDGDYDYATAKDIAEDIRTQTTKEQGEE